MRKVIQRVLPIVALILCIGYNTFGQASVSEATKDAQKIIKKVSKGRIKGLIKTYPAALEEMEKILAEAETKEFGYDNVLQKINGWINLHNILKNKFGDGPITYKDYSLELKYKDYSSLKPEFQKKALKAHYDAAVKILNEVKNYEKRMEAVTHFYKAAKYAFDDEKTKIEKERKEAIAVINYDEGVRLINEGADFKEKQKACDIFKKIPGSMRPYKDVNDLCAKLFYDQAMSLAPFTEQSHIVSAVNNLRRVKKYVENYKDTEAKEKELVEKGTEMLYQQGLAKENEPTFEAQKEASKLFKRIDKYWTPGYKDIAKRIAKAENRAYARIIAVDAYGDALSPLSKLKKETTDNILMPAVGNKLDGIDMLNPANYSKAQQLLGYNFIVIKAGKKGDIKFSKQGPSTTTEDKTTYYLYKKGADGKIIEKKETKSQYNISVALIKAAKDDAGQTHKKYEGKLHTTTTRTSAWCKYNVEIWDYRDLANPVLLGTKPGTFSRDSKLVTQTYTGDAKAKPSGMVASRGKLKSESELKAELEKVKLSLTSSISMHAKDYAAILNNKVKYCPITVEAVAK